MPIGWPESRHQCCAIFEKRREEQRQLVQLFPKLLDQLLHCCCSWKSPNFVMNSQILEPILRRD